MNKVNAGASLEIDLDRGMIKDIIKAKVYSAQSFPKFMQDLIKAGGLMPYIRKRYKR